MNHTVGLMLVAAWHLLVAAFRATIDAFGATPLAVTVTVGLYFLGLLLVWFQKGGRATLEHWKSKFGLALALPLVVWGLIFIWNVVYMIFNDHQALKARIDHLSEALESKNNLFEDAAIDWDGRGPVTFVATALRGGKKLHVYLDIRQGPGSELFSAPVFEGKLVNQPRVEVGYVDYFVPGQVLKVTLATVHRVAGNQMVFQWGDPRYANYSVGVSQATYVGRLAFVEEGSSKELHTYFAVVGRSFSDDPASSPVIGPAYILGPSALWVVKDWDRSR